MKMNRERIRNYLEAGCLGTAAVLLIGLLCIVVRSGMTRGEKVGCYSLCALIALTGFLLWRVLRSQVVSFSDTVCHYVDTLAEGEVPQINGEEDTLLSKIQMKLDKLSDLTYSAAARQTRQKQEVQKMVSDISHQLKTPIANITMYTAMLENEGLSPEQRKKFCHVVSGQVEKMEFLVEALAKMSRLESRLIVLDSKPARIFDTLAHAVMQVSNAAEKKKIDIQIDGDEQLMVPHDPKWTGEAFFNIIDNAVKYTPEGGRVSIHTEAWELFTKIDIRDTGIGIAKEHYQDIFKRFYREGKVHLAEGVGIGLYLSREIIAQQGGYIKVKSEEHAGSIFSVFLPNQDEVIPKSFHDF